MELAHGHVITLTEAARLGVLDAAEGLVRESANKPWEVITPADLPVVQDGDGDGDGDEETKEPRAEMADEAHNVSLYRAMHHLNKGGLHRALGIPEGQEIPADRLAAAKNSKNEHVAKMAHFAATMKGFHHGG